MSIFDDLKAKIDANGDGKLNLGDLESLKDQLPADQFDKLKDAADRNGDGKIGVEDLQSIDLGGATDSVKSAFGGMFKK